MIPIGPIIVALLFASGRMGNGRVTVGNDRAAAVLLWLLVAPLWLGVVVALAMSGRTDGALAAVALGGAGSVVFAPSLWIALCVHRGWTRPAAALSALCLWRWAGDRVGAAVCNGAMAAARKAGRQSPVEGGAGAPTRAEPSAARGIEPELARLDARVARAKYAHGALLLGEALLSRLRSDDARADALLRSIVWLPPELVPPRVRGIGAEIAIGEALIAGDLRRAAQVPASGSPTAALLSACAQALAAPRAPPSGRAGAWRWRLGRRALRWRIQSLALRVRAASVSSAATSRPKRERPAPSRPAPSPLAAAADGAPMFAPTAPSPSQGAVGLYACLRRLIEDAQAALRPGAAAAAPPSSTITVAPPTDDLPPLQAAVLRIAHAWRHDVIAAADVTALALAVQAAPDALADAPGAAEELHPACVTSLEQAADAAAARFTASERARFRALTGVGGAVDDALAELEMLVEPLPRDVPLCASAELFEWVRLRAAYARSVDEDDAAYAPYAAVRDALWNHSANLFNKGQRGLGRAMFRFLHDEAERRGDADCLKGMEKNLRA